MRHKDQFICIACNEDGYGPSALAYYLVRAITALWRIKYQSQYNLKIYLFNNSAYDFNLAIYHSMRDVVQPVRLRKDSLIRLEKEKGEIAISKTLNRIKLYRPYRQKYRNEIQSYLKNCHVTVDLGVPLFTRAAKKQEIPHRITLFDHSWAETLRLACSEQYHSFYQYHDPPDSKECRLVRELARDIEEDEACATAVWLFEPYITADVFWKHWNQLLHPDKPVQLDGVLGSRHDSGKAREILNQQFSELGQKTLSNSLNRKESGLVLVSPGGTPVWADLLPKWIDAMIADPPQRFVPVFSNPKGVNEKQTRTIKEKMRQSGTVRWFELIKGHTQQIILPAFDLIVTRAGGATVNDALAAKVPFACIEERHVQVKMIEEACYHHGLIPRKDIRISDFNQDPVQMIDQFYNKRMSCMENIQNIRTGIEIKLAENILSLLT